MQALRPAWTLKPSPYLSVFHWHEDSTVYTPESLKNWTPRELIIKHYHLTARLDGYNHLVESPALETMKKSVLVFREELARRGIDGVRHCMQMDWAYDAGYRKVQVFYPPLLTAPEAHR